MTLAPRHQGRYDLVLTDGEVLAAAVCLAWPGAPVQWHHPDVGTIDGAQVAQAAPVQVAAPHGQLDRAEVERRVLTACRTIRAMPRVGPKGNRGNSFWDQIVKEPGKGDYTGIELRPDFGATDVNDDAAADWLARLSQWGDAHTFAGLTLSETQWLFWWRSMAPRGVSFTEIGRRLRCGSGETARRRYVEAVSTAWRVANGFEEDNRDATGVMEQGARARMGRGRR
ncbi:MAG: hypothetical protein AAFO79_01325 [Pseudomonadota bacterium]